MTKENVLYSMIGVLLGFIVGFAFANTTNQRGNAVPAARPEQQTQGLPPDHPPIEAISQTGVKATEVEAALKAAKEQPDKFDLQKRAAELSYRAQRYDEAAEYWTRANRLRPDDPLVLVGLGNAKFDSEKYAEAEKWYAAAL